MNGFKGTTTNWEIGFMIFMESVFIKVPWNMDITEHIANIFRQDNGFSLMTKK